MENDNYYTLKGYERSQKQQITHSMEDYLEMICRSARQDPVVRIGHLAGKLHVKPSSASKMVGNLRELGLVEFEKYGTIRLTDRGRELGDYLLYRHQVIHAFLKLLNGTDDELNQVEQIEHFLDKRTVGNLEQLIKAMEGTDWFPK